MQVTAGLLSLGKGRKDLTFQTRHGRCHASGEADETTTRPEFPWCTILFFFSGSSGEAAACGPRTLAAKQRGRAAATRLATCVVRQRGVASDRRAI